MSLIRLLVIVIVILCCNRSFAEEAEWNYVDPTSTGPMGSLRISEDKNVITYSEHVAYHWTECDPKKEKYAVCFESPQLFMKLPYSVLGNEEWTEDGILYSTRHHKDVRLLGQALGDIYVISIEDPEKWGYIYSPDRGVVAFIFSQSGLFEIAIVVGQCGYGAPASCYES